jgi:hypothetical protein
MYIHFSAYRVCLYSNIPEHFFRETNIPGHGIGQVHLFDIYSSGVAGKQSTEKFVGLSRPELSIGPIEYVQSCIELKEFF